MQQRASIRFRVFFFVMTAAMLVFAFVHSAMPAAVSAEESGGVLDFLLRLLPRLGISIELTDHIVRKLAHFTEFTLIGMLVTTCAYSFDRLRPYRYSVYVLFTGLAAAVTDETIQLFSEGRSGQVTDVLIDFSGVAIGMIMMMLCFTLYIQIRKRKGKE